MSIQVIALRSFPWSEDGYTSKFAAEKEVFDLPDHMFDGLNKAGYVRRAVIGDGHFALRNEAKGVPLYDPRADAPNPSEADVPASPIDDSSEASAPEAGTEAPASAAPRPASATAPISAEEAAALKDGSWKDWRFFKQRSVAAKLSDQPMKRTEDVVPVLEAEASRLNAG